MSCHNDECGSSRQPCDTAIPETCEALPTVTSGARVLVEDDNSCKRGLTSESTGALLLYDDQGRVIWRDGSVSKPIVLPNLQTKEGTATGVIVNDNGTIKSLVGTTGEVEPEVLIDDGTTVRWKARSEIFGEATKGALVINSAGVASWATGATGTQLIMGANGPSFTSPTGESAVTAFRDISGLIINYTSSNVITLSVSSAVLKNAANEYIAITTPATVQIDRTAVGAGGVEQGVSIGTSRGYWIFLIHNTTTSTTSAMITESYLDPSPSALPAGYTFFRRVGYVRTTYDAKFSAGYFQRDKSVNFGYGCRVLVKSQSASNTNAFDSGVVTYEPSNVVSHAVYQMGISGSHAAGVKANSCIASSGTAGALFGDIEVFGGATLETIRDATSYYVSFQAVIPPNLTSYWRVDTLGMTTTEVFSLFVTGYELIF